MAGPCWFKRFFWTYLSTFSCRTFIYFLLLLLPVSHVGLFIVKSVTWKSFCTVRFLSSQESIRKLTIIVLTKSTGKSIYVYQLSEISIILHLITVVSADMLVNTGIIGKGGVFHQHASWSVLIVKRSRRLLSCHIFNIFLCRKKV